MSRRNWSISVAMAALLLPLCGCPYTQYLAHYAKFANWSTRITLQNPHPKDLDATLVALDENGAAAATQVVTVPAKGFYSEMVENIFLTAIPDQGTIQISADEPSNVRKLTGLALFGYGGGQAIGGLQTFSNPKRVLQFPWFENSAANMTGIAILNTETYPIQVFLRAASSTGTQYDSPRVTLGAKQKILGYVGDYFPRPDALPDNAVLTAYGSGNIAGFLVLHDPAVTHMEAINGVPGETTTPRLAQAPSTGPALTGNPSRIAFTSDGNYLVIRQDELITTYDRYNNAIYGTASVHSGSDMVLNATGQFLYYSSSVDDKIYSGIVPGPGLIFLPTAVASFSNPVRLAVSRDGRFLGAVNAKDWRIWDLEHGNALVNSGTIAAGTLMDCIFSNDSSHFVFLDYGNNTVYRVRLSDFATGQTAMSDDVLRIAQCDFNDDYYVSSDSKILVLDGLSFTELASIPVDSTPYFLHFSPDGQNLYIPCYGTHVLQVYSVPLGRFLTTNYNLMTFAYPTTLSPEGDALFFIDDSFHIRWAE